MSTVDKGLRDQVRDRYARAGVDGDRGRRGRGLLRRRVWGDGAGRGGRARSAPACTRRVRRPSCRRRRCWPAWAAATRWRWPSCGRVSGCWTWVRAAGSTCCCRRSRVGATGFAYGLDMTDEMLQLARANAAKAGATNVEFLKGHIEDIPLPDASVDVVISNCVINLSVDKPAVLARDVPGADPGRPARHLRRGRRGPAERRPTGPSAAPTSGASPAPCPARSTWTGWPRPGSSTPRSTFTHEAAPGMRTRRSSARADPAPPPDHARRGAFLPGRGAGGAAVTRNARTAPAHASSR